MAKKTLEKKIKLVCQWALGLTITYFVIGAFLISDGSKFDSVKTYNLLKDTLTLSAAFLAPVAAFVLFSDWKEEHIEKKLDSISDRLSIDISDIELTLWQSHYKPAISIKGCEINLSEHLDKGSLFAMRKKLENDINNLSGMNSISSSLVSQLSAFVTCAQEIENKIRILKFDDSNNSDEKIPQEKRFEYMDTVNSGLEKIGILKKSLLEALNELKIKTS